MVIVVIVIIVSDSDGDCCDGGSDHKTKVILVPCLTCLALCFKVKGSSETFREE